MANLTRVVEILAEINEEDLMDDRREYDVEDLMTGYEIDEATAVMLRLNIEARTDETHNVLMIQEAEAVPMLKIIQENVQAGLDGWTEEEKAVIIAFLSDVAVATDEWE